MSTKERREREKQQRKRTIIKAALEVLREDGFARISMDKIAERAELSKGALYLYFENKEKLIIEIFWMLMEKLKKKIKDIISSDEKLELEEKLNKLIGMVLDFYSNEVEFFVFMNNALIGLSSDMMQELKKTAVNFSIELNEIMEKLFEEYNQDRYKYSTLEMNIAFRGIIKNFLVEKFFGVYKQEKIRPEMLTDIFLRGVMK